MKKYIYIAGILVAFIFPLVSSAALDTNLKYGSSGASVVELQEFLTSQNLFSGPLSGNFYSLTLAAVKAFQTKEGISPISGYWGPLTRAQASTVLDLSASDTDEKTETGNIASPVVANTPCTNGAVFSFVTGAPCNPVTGVAPTQTQQIVNPPVMIPTPVINSPTDVYSIRVTSPVGGDEFHTFIAIVGQDNQFSVNLLKGPTSIDQYETETNPKNTDLPVSISGTIQVINNTDGTTNTISTGNIWSPAFFTIHPTQLGDISVTLKDAQDNVVKNITVQTEDPTPNQSLYAYSSFSNQTVSSNSGNIELGSFVLTTRYATNVMNLKPSFSGNFDLKQLTNIITVVRSGNVPQNSTSFPVNPNAGVMIEVWGNIGNSTGTITTSLSVEPNGNGLVPVPLSATGQTITVQ